MFTRYLRHLANVQQTLVSPVTTSLLTRPIGGKAFDPKTFAVVRTRVQH
jgi:hypothetical protein